MTKADWEKKKPFVSTEDVILMVRVFTNGEVHVNADPQLGADGVKEALAYIAAQVAPGFEPATPYPPDAVPDYDDPIANVLNRITRHHFKEE